MEDVLRWKIIEHPTAAWAAHQFRMMIVSGESPHRFVVHDSRRFYYEHMDRTLEAMVSSASIPGDAH